MKEAIFQSEFVAFGIRKIVAQIATIMLASASPRLTLMQTMTRRFYKPLFNLNGTIYQEVDTKMPPFIAFKIK